MLVGQGYPWKTRKNQKFDIDGLVISALGENPRQAMGEDREDLVRDSPQALCPLRDRDTLIPVLPKQRGDVSLERLRYVGDIDQTLVHRDRSHLPSPPTANQKVDPV